MTCVTPKHPDRRLTTGKGATYLSNDGGREGAAVIHPAIHAGLCVQLTRVGESSIQVKEMPLRLQETTTLLWLQVWVQWDEDSQESILPEDPSAISRDSVIVKDVHPAAVSGDGCSKVFQYNVRVHHEAGDTKQSCLKDLESSLAPNLLQDFMKSHRGGAGDDPQEEPQWL